MKRRHFLQSGTLASAALVTAGPELIAQAVSSARETCDVFVYGSTPGGLAAGLAASVARETSTTVAALDPDPLPGKLGIQVVP